MSQASLGNSIEDVYRSVINDVINHVKEAFLDENVDVEVLLHLKQLWENKIRDSGAVDLDGPKHLPARAPPPQRAAHIHRPQPPSSAAPVPTTLVIHNPSQANNTQIQQQSILNQTQQQQPANAAISAIAEQASQPQQVQLQQSLNNLSQIINMNAAELQQQQQHVQQQQAQQLQAQQQQQQQQLQQQQQQTQQQVSQQQSFTLPHGLILLSGAGSARTAVLQNDGHHQLKESIKKEKAINMGAPYRQVSGVRAPSQVLMMNSQAAQPLQQQMQQPLQLQSGSVGLQQQQQLQLNANLSHLVRQQNINLAQNALQPGFVLLSNNVSGNRYTLLQSDGRQEKREDGPSSSRIPQLDGGAPGMSDSSTSEEEEEEDMGKLEHYETLGGKLEDGDANDEDPLNSDDDQSDDEDLETLFEADNVVVCQFEKVHRARNKWKFTLKDGIMRIDGKEYCFQKCAGDAEW